MLNRVGYSPSVCMATPPASVTSNTPAATSQQWWPYSNRASYDPDATSVKAVTDDPLPRILQPAMNEKWMKNKFTNTRGHRLGAYDMKRVAAGAHLPTPWLFEPAKHPNDTVNYCPDCSLLLFDICSWKRPPAIFPITSTGFFCSLSYFILGKLPQCERSLRKLKNDPLKYISPLCVR